MKRIAMAALAGCCSALAACASSGAARSEAGRLPPAASAETAPKSSSAADTGARQTPASAEASVARGREQAHAWLVAALGCWLGGVWSDAERAKEEERITAAEARCRELARRLDAGDPALFTRLRALDASAVAALHDKIAASARGDAVDEPRAPQLLRLFDAIAEVEREEMKARHAALEIKRDIGVAQPASKRQADELRAVAPLRESSALEGLLRLELGDLGHDGRAVALLYALDRMELARGLPTHLKLYAVERSFAALFGVAPPDVPVDASKPIKGGIWLAYLTRVAEAAGHAVPASAQAHRDQELMAWGGAFEGLADKLRAEAEPMSDATEFKRVIHAVVRRLETEYRASEAAVREAPRPSP